MCPHGGGILVVKEKKVLAKIKVKSDGFNLDGVVDFGPDGAPRKTSTPLVLIKDVPGIDVGVLYD